jgi:hypothetical protein
MQLCQLCRDGMCSWLTKHKFPFEILRPTETSLTSLQPDFHHAAPCLRLKHVHVHYSIFVHDLIQTFYSMQHAACSMQHAAHFTHAVVNSYSFIH